MVSPHIESVKLELIEKTIIIFYYFKNKTKFMLNLMIENIQYIKFK